MSRRRQSTRLLEPPFLFLQLALSGIFPVDSLELLDGFYSVRPEILVFLREHAVVHTSLVSSEALLFAAGVLDAD